VSVLVRWNGDFATFAGTTRLTPPWTTITVLTGVAFASGAGSFTLGTPGKHADLTGLGITNNSTALQTVNTPVTQTAGPDNNAAAGNLAISQAVTNGGYLLSFDGNSNSIVSGTLLARAGLAKNGAAGLTLSGANSVHRHHGRQCRDAGSDQTTHHQWRRAFRRRLLGGWRFCDRQWNLYFQRLDHAFYESSGTVSVNAFNANANDGTLFQIAGGSFSATSLTLPRAVSFTTAPTATAPIAGATNSGLYINGPELRSLGTLSIASGNSSASVRLDAGPWS